MANPQELTINLVAELLNVSQTFLVKLLASGVIPYRVVNEQKLICYQDILNYKQQWDR